MLKKINGTNVALLIAAGFAGVTAANAHVINAASYNLETHPADVGIIRNMATKVGYIKSHPTEPTYMAYYGYDVTGATHVTVRASGGTTTGGALALRFGRPAGTNAAVVDITPTGSWNTFQDFTVALNKLESDNSRGLPIYAVVDTRQLSYKYDLQSIKFERSNVGTAIEAESFSRERFGSYDDDVKIMGNQVGYIKQSYNWVEFDNINFVGGARSVTFSAASANPQGGTVIIYDGFPGRGIELGRVQIDYTGGWDIFRNFSANIPFIAGGTKNISLQFMSRDGGTSYLFDLDKFTFNLDEIDNLGIWFNAAKFDVESQPSNQEIIRNMGNKVGYIKNSPDTSAYEYFMFDKFDITGAKSVTIRYSSAGTGGELDVCSQSFYSNQLARFVLVPTGGWNIVKEVTMPIDQSVVANHGSGESAGMLVFSIFEPGNDTKYKFDIHAFKFNR